MRLLGTIEGYDLALPIEQLPGDSAAHFDGIDPGYLMLSIVLSALYPADAPFIDGVSSGLAENPRFLQLRTVGATRHDTSSKDSFDEEGEEHAAPSEENFVYLTPIETFVQDYFQDNCNFAVLLDLVCTKKLIRHDLASGVGQPFAKGSVRSFSRQVIHGGRSCHHGSPFDGLCLGIMTRVGKCRRLSSHV